MHGLLQPQAPSSTTANALATTGAPVNVSNAAPPVAGEDFYASSATQGEWGNRLPRTFNVKHNKHSNLAGDGVDVWGVNITSGTAALNVTGAAFTAADVGKVIGVEGAGVSGAWLITTISSYTDATNVVLATNASTTVSSVFATKLYNAFYGTDDTAALQALIMAVYRDGSGNYLGNAKLIFPDALYIINGSLQNNVSVPGYESFDNAIDFNSQIYIPGLPPDAQNPNPGSRANGNIHRHRWSITLEGETPPHWLQTADTGGTFDETSPVTGTRIRSTIQGSGNYYPSIICAKGGGTTLGANGVNNNKFGPDLVVRNICFQYTASASSTSTMCGVNGDRAKTTLYSNVVVFPHNLSLQNMAVPTMNTVGLIPAGAGDEMYNVTEFCNVGGFKYGYFSGEHFSIRDSSAWVCESALGLIDSMHVVNIDLLDVSACKYGVSKVSTGAFSYSLVRGCLTGEMRYEGWTTKWWSNEAQVNDPSNYVYGELTLAPLQGVAGYNGYRASKLGGQNIKTRVIGDFALYVLHTGTTYTLQYLYEAQQVHNFSNAAAITLTVPRGDTATVAGYCYNYDIGAEIKCMQGGAGQVTPTAAAGVTLRLPTGMTKSAGQYSEFTLRKIGTNIWSVFGDLA